MRKSNLILHNLKGKESTLDITIEDGKNIEGNVVKSSEEGIKIEKNKDNKTLTITMPPHSYVVCN